MSKKSLKKNYVYNVCYQILLIITPLIVAPYLSRIFNPDGIGAISFAESIISYFVLFATMGITTYGQREVSYFQDDEKKRTVAFYNTFIMKLAIAAIVLILYLILVYVLWRDNFQMYIVMGFGILAVIFDITYFFQGLEEFGIIVLRNVLFKILSVILIFLLIKKKEDIVLYLFVVYFTTFVSNLSLWFGVKKYLVSVKIKKLKPFKDFYIALSLFFPTVAIQVYTVLDKTMIGVITKNAAENGYYEQAIKIPRIALAVVTAVSTVAIPRIGFFYKKKDFKSLKKLMYKSYRFVWFLAVPIALGLFMVSDNFVPWFFGQDFYKTSSLLKILSFLVIIIGISNITGIEYMVSTKKQNKLTLSVSIGAIINFCLNLLLIGKFMSTGAAVASIVAEIIITVVQLYLVKKDINTLEVIKNGLNYIFSGLIMMLILFIFTRNFVPSIKNTIIIILIGAVTYFAILLLIHDEFLYENIGIVLKRIKKVRS